MRYFITLLFAAIGLAFTPSLGQTTSTPTYFTGTWTCLDSTGVSAPGYLPGSLHDALIRSGIISDPFVGTNEKEISWVNEKTWIFTSNPFAKPEGNWEHLQVDGVQLYSSWKLNGNEIGETDNAFKPFTIDLADGINDEENVLEVSFASISTEDRTMHRMPQFMFGWDWGPTLIDRSVRSLNLVEKPDGLKNLYLRTATVNGRSAAGVIEWDYEGQGDESVVWAISEPGGKVVARGRDDASKGVDNFLLENPRLWWTHDMGTPFLYNLELVVLSPGKGMVDTQIQKVGIRTLELNTDDGAFQFILNGKPIYAKGANYIPTDVIETRENKIEEMRLLESAIMANMNMLRVWGGGDYATDSMMEFCDENGLLIWHDFMFACAMYPGDEEFLASVSSEATAQTLRLRHHPSMALWCGNNEISEGWERWGWQDGLSKSEKEEEEIAYESVFGEILPSIVSEHTNIAYWESSPKLGRGDSNFRNEGDAHDWGIWHDGYAFDSLWSRVPRFMSEYGFQSFPVNHTLATVLTDDSVLFKAGFRENPEVVNHEKHPRGFDIIDSYLSMTHSGLNGVSTTLEDFSYLSRVIQAEGIAEGAIAGRVNMGHCWGSLVWQLNDCWPVASWSSIDARGNWKLLHHELKKAFAPELLHGKLDGKNLRVYLVSDRMSNGLKSMGKLTVELYDLNGNQRKTVTEDLELVSGGVTTLYLENFLSKKIDRNNAVVVITYKAGIIELEDFVYSVTPGKLALEPTDFKVTSLGKIGNRYRVKVSSTKFAKSVELSAGVDGNFSENGFDLMPGETKVVDFTPHNGDVFAPTSKGKRGNSNSTPEFSARSLRSLPNN